jgi:hypothetical protein
MHDKYANLPVVEAQRNAMFHDRAHQIIDATLTHIESMLMGVFISAGNPDPIRAVHNMMKAAKEKAVIEVRANWTDEEWEECDAPVETTQTQGEE